MNGWLYYRLLLLHFTDTGMKQLHYLPSALPAFCSDQRLLQESLTLIERVFTVLLDSDNVRLQLPTVRSEV